MPDPGRRSHGALIEELDVRFARSASEITGDPKESMFRIYRDIRFSKHKSPYKVHAACWFWQVQGPFAGERSILFLTLARHPS